jgi:hypothetical protein
VRSDRAIRRPWALVCCAFAFCWYNLSQQTPALAPAQEDTASSPVSAAPPSTPSPTSPSEAGRGENERDIAWTPPAVLARGDARGAHVVGAVDHAVALLARVVDRAPAGASRQVA